MNRREFFKFPLIGAAAGFFTSTRMAEGLATPPGPRVYTLNGSPGSNYWRVELGKEPRDAEGHLHVKNYYMSAFMLKQQGIDVGEVLSSPESVEQFARRAERSLPEGSVVIGACRPYNQDELILNVSNPAFESVGEFGTYPEERLDVLS